MAGRTWSDDEVFEALLLAVLSSNTDWSKIERVRAELSDLFSGFSLKSYAALSEAESATVTCLGSRRERREQ